jgi:hypothetical protein
MSGELTHASKFLAQFAQPDPRFSPTPIWWWSGEKLEIGRMRWQMDQLVGMNICNVVVLNLAPSGTLFCCDADDPPFLSEPWWQIFEQVCDHARTIGMFIWFYDQIGFSGANYQAQLVAAHPQFAAERIRRTVVEGTGHLRAECPRAATPLAAYVVDRTGAHYVSIEERGVSIRVTTLSKLCLVYTLRQGYDYFNRDACEKLLDTVHRQFARRLPRHIGSTIVGSFQDELPDLPTWSRDFSHSFSQSFGYRLEDVIHRLFEPGEAGSSRTRLHYHQHRANLAEEALFKPFFHWHEEHGLQCGFDQQSPAREGRALGCVQKYADYIQTHRWYAAPGCDLHGNASLHSSIAFMYNRPRVWIEGFHSTGWGGTIADTFDWLLPFLRSGANLYNPHAVYYSTRMGWWEWAPPSTCWRQPYARHYKGFADMIARLTKLLSQGTHLASVGVLFPTATVQSAVGPEGHFPDAHAADQVLHRLIGSMKWYENQPGVLDSLGLDFHLLDEATLQSAAVSAAAPPGTTTLGAKLLYNGVAIGTLVLPHVTVLDDATVVKLHEFARGGGRIVAVGSDQIETPDGQTLQISALENAIFFENVEHVGSTLNNVPREVCSPVPFMHRQRDDMHILFVPAIAGMATRVKWTDWFATLDTATADPARYLKEADIRLPPHARNVWRFDPIDAGMKPLKATGGQVKLDFGGSPFVVLAWSERDTAPNEVESGRPSRALTLGDSWSCQYVPTLPTEHADIYDPRRPELRLPHTAEFTWKYNGQEQVVRATFGIHGATDTGPLVYSPQFGIPQDRMHWYTLGPKGHVPEEFIDLGQCEAGSRRTIRTSVVSDRPREVMLAIGANARKAVSICGQHLEALDNAYLWNCPIRLSAGENALELTLTAERSERVRAFWCLLEPGAESQFMRPERMIPPDAPVAGSRLSFRHVFLSPQLPQGRLLVTTASVSSVWLDGVLLGRLGGFDPYRLQLRSQPFDMPTMQSGHHELRIESIDPGTVSPLSVDALAGEARIMSSASWSVSRDGGSYEPVDLYSKQENDGASWHLYRRPHPLPQTAWLEGPQPPVVLDLPIVPPCDHAVQQTFEWTIPPGAKLMQLRLQPDVEARLLVDGQPHDIDSQGTVTLASKEPAARRAVLHACTRHLAGGVFTAPVSYEFSAGHLSTGSWLMQGLRSYSGAIRMTQRFQVDKKGSDPLLSASLDLGRVRGTVEAHLNGRPVGARFLPPSQFDLDDALRDGENELELLVTNTLANFLSTWSPTRGWSPDQFECGVSGPVTIRY